jgi:hypothetical protein
MKKLSSFINQTVATIRVKELIVALMIFTIVACGGGNILPGIVNGTSRVVHLITIPHSGHRIAPSTSATPFLAAMFAVSATPSQLAQSYDVQCTISQNVPPGALIPIPGLNSAPGFCDETASAADPINEGKPTFTDGTLSTLVVTAKGNGTSFQCRDLTNSLAILDNSFTAAYLDSASHQVKVFNQAPNGSPTQVPFVCNNIGSDAAPVTSIEVQWVKQ